MKTIQVLGTGCAKCHKLEEHSKQAVAELGLDCEVVRITNVKEIMGYGVVMTPALAVDGTVKAAGKLLSVDEIKQLLQ